MLDKPKQVAIDSARAFSNDTDMTGREQSILGEISEKTGFIPEKVIWRSSYWGTKQIGAVHYQGRYNAKTAVLKIQGAKPEISEIFMIKQFDSQNRSKLIRAPKLFTTIQWQDANQYEAIIMEHVKGKKVLQSKQIQPEGEINDFLDIYEEYKKNCIPQKPWIGKPEKISMIGQAIDLIKVSEKAYPNDPRKKVGDKKLVMQAAKKLDAFYSPIPLEFMHGHFSVEDLIYQDNEVILFSNLFWKWRYPFHDAVFGYHWFMYELAHVPGITKEKIEAQRRIWLSSLQNLSVVKESKKNQKLLYAALLERAIAGVIIDSLLVDKKSSVAAYLLEAARCQIQILLGKLSREG